MASPLALRKRLDRIADHAAIDRRQQAVLFGYRHEEIRADVALRAAHAQQDLVVLALVAVQTDDRLIEQRELAVVDGIAHERQPMPVLLILGFVLRGRIDDADAIAAFALR